MSVSRSIRAALLAALLATALAFPATGVPSAPLADLSAAVLATPSRVVAACTTGVRCLAPRVAVRTAIPLTPSVPCSRSGARCRLSYDLYAPVGGGPWPVLVLSPGGPSSPTGGGHLVDLATRIAGTGAVVLVGSWRQGDRYGGTIPTAFRDIGCAVRTARNVAAAVGGSPARVALVGHSLGGWGGAIVALDAVRSRPTADGCLAGTGSARPDAFIGLAGAYAGIEGAADDVDWVDLIGATSASRPDLWRVADPVAVARYSNAAAIPIVLVHGTADTGVAVSQTTAFARALRSAGRTPRVVLVSGAGHMTLLTHPTTLTEIARVLDRIATR